MSYRQTPCDNCKSNLIDSKTEKKVLVNGAIEEVYQEKCSSCGNLLYGYSRRFKNEA